MKAFLMGLVLVLALAGVAGSQIIGVSPIIERLVPSDTRGGWVKIDKNYSRPGHAKVYCITVDGMLSCGWNDVRRIKPATLSENW